MMAEIPPGLAMMFRRFSGKTLALVCLSWLLSLPGGQAYAQMLTGYEGDNPALLPQNKTPDDGSRTILEEQALPPAVDSQSENRAVSAPLTAFMPEVEAEDVTPSLSAASPSRQPDVDVSSNVLVASGRQPYLTAFDSFDSLEKRSIGNDTPAQGASDKNSQPVDLQADDLTHDEATREVIARGHVKLRQAGRMLEADEVRYNLASDKASASGHVVLTDENGDVHSADHVELSGDLKNGLVEQLSSVLIDGSRFKAEEGVREGGTKTIMKEASYTPCEPCKLDPEKSPLWQIKASSVTHNEEEHSIEYEDARFEFLGVPLAYVPYLSHSDGTVKRKSGLLPPTAGYKSNLGGLCNGGLLLRYRAGQGCHARCTGVYEGKSSPDGAIPPELG
ncbi:MAG: hypothetical protein LRY39_02125 [Alphaproteobacteria bacterium]|nr:hypothetical protein [Alphaproteobacteria bacterium]